MLWVLFSRGWGLVRAVLQAFELLHFMLRLRRLSLLTIKASQSEMRLRRQ
jgi:hypothetical protein